MRHEFSEIWLLGCLITLASGCAASRHTVVALPVGPAPSAMASHATEGSLVVYSALDIGSPGDPPYTRYYSGYHLCSADGQRLKYISNRAGARGEQPARVTLLPGRYKEPEEKK